MRIINFLVPFLVFEVLLAGCGSKEKKTAAQLQSGAGKPPPMQVEVFVAKASILNETIEVPGSLLAFETTEIHPEVSGRVVQLNVREGNFVSRGALLVKLYDEDLRAQMKKLEIQLDIARTTEERQGKLLKIQGISQQDYDLSLLNVNNIKADIDIIRTTISKTEIRAPFSGKLGLRNISPGAFITPTTIVTTISVVNQLKLQFTVPEKYSSRIKTGQDIQFTLDGSSKTYSGKVAATEVFIEENTRSFAVRAIVKSDDAYLIPGAFAKVRIELGRNDEAIMVPTQAIIPQGRKKQLFLFKNGKAMPSDVTTGVRDSSNVQVITGLNQGDTVITTGLLYLKPGSDVLVRKTSSPSQ